MLLHSIRPVNLLSYGSQTDSIELQSLNVLIGPNGSGKSNLIDVLALLRSTPGDIATLLSQRGGVSEWMWKGREAGRAATLSVHVAKPRAKVPLRYALQFREEGNRLLIDDERIENAQPFAGHDEPFFYYRFENGRPVLNVGGESRRLQREQIDSGASILSQRKDPDQYPELTYLGQAFGSIRIYRDWVFGRDAPARQAQRADVRNDFLDEDCLNLALVLSQLRREPATKRRLIGALRELYAGVDDLEVVVEAGRAQIFFQEGPFSVPSTRLSDGTLRYLCLLAILCHPKPPPLVCIEEPELGLHPDVMPAIAKLLIEASQRTQLVVTTHSDILIDALTESPECVLVCEKSDGATSVQRLDTAKLEGWLKEYRLGTLWTMGRLGGTRW